MSDMETTKPRQKAEAGKQLQGLKSESCKTDLNYGSEQFINVRFFTRKRERSARRKKVLTKSRKEQKLGGKTKKERHLISFQSLNFLISIIIPRNLFLNNTIFVVYTIPHVRSVPFLSIFCNRGSRSMRRSEQKGSKRKKPKGKKKSRQLHFFQLIKNIVDNIIPKYLYFFVLFQEQRINKYELP